MANSPASRTFRRSSHLVRPYPVRLPRQLARWVVDVIVNSNRWIQQSLGRRLVVVVLLVLLVVVIAPGRKLL